MRRRFRTLLLVLGVALAAACTGTPAPAPPPAAPAPPPPAPPPAPRELESPVAPERKDELRREAAEALAETRGILGALDAGMRRERAEAVATVESLVDESRRALAEGDVERAHNLAQKALALAREL